MARGIDCTDPDELLALYPCLNCVSERELWIILAGMFAVGQSLDDLDALSTSAAKYRNLDEREFLQMLISVLPEEWFAGLTSENLGEDFSCWQCKGDQEIKAIFLYVWCNFWENYTPA